MSAQVTDPVELFLACRRDALEAGAAQGATIAVLATATPDGAPSARCVLVKEVSDDGFFLYTNYQSRKARELEANPRAALCVHWVETGVQFRIEGDVTRTSGAQSDRYFASRPRESQLGAWASDQSTPIESRDALLARFAEAEARYEGAVPRPAEWGGYRLVPKRVEHWQNGPHRLHDRLLYVRDEAGWHVTRLAP